MITVTWKWISLQTNQYRYLKNRKKAFVCKRFHTFDDILKIFVGVWLVLVIFSCNDFINLISQQPDATIIVEATYFSFWAIKKSMWVKRCGPMHSCCADTTYRKNMQIYVSFVFFCIFFSFFKSCGDNTTGYWDSPGPLKAFDPWLHTQC